MTGRPDVDTLAERIAKELPNPSWAHAALSDLAARARQADFAKESEAHWVREADRLARRVTELEAALREIIDVEDKTYWDWDDPSAGFAAIARAALAGDGGGA